MYRKTILIVICAIVFITFALYYAENKINHARKEKENVNDEQLLSKADSIEIEYQNRISQFENDPAFINYLTRITDDYSIIAKGDDYLIFNVGNVYYFFSPANFILTDVRYVLIADRVCAYSKTNDKIEFQPVFHNGDRDKYDLSSHLLKLYIPAGSDYSDLFSHISKSNYSIDMWKLFFEGYYHDVGIENTPRNSEQNRDSESTKFIQQLK